MTSLKAKKRRFRTAYCPPVRVGFSTVGESRTHPEFAEDLKIQNIINRYDTEGYLSTVDRHASYSDFTDVNDLHAAMEKVKNANEDFQKVPSYIRERFDNDPRLFYDFATNPENAEELSDMGLLKNPIQKRQVEPVQESQPIVEKTQDPSNEGS